MQSGDLIEIKRVNSKGKSVTTVGDLIEEKSDSVVIRIWGLFHLVSRELMIPKNKISSVLVLKSKD